MMILRRTLLVLSVLFPSFAFAQSADQAIVSVVDSPDPVVPGQTLTYTITFQNNGPDPATNGGVNLLLDGNFTPTSVTPPAGFNCTPLAQIMTCNTPSFAPGAPVVLTVMGTVAPHLNAFPDGTLTSTFTTSGVTPDPVGGNNSFGAVVTAYNSPQIDLSVAVTDNPDPVFPDGNITYTVDVTNAGPDTATSVNFNSFNNGTLRYQSITVPAGWSCPSQPAVNGNPTFTCTNPSFAPGTSQFIVVVKADDDVLGINDGTVQQTFSVNGTGDDTNDNNNLETESTAYVTPDADVTISVTDSPDPVFPDGNITYTVTVGNTGPDTAPNISLNSFGGNNLRFVSATVPAGWNCTLPAANAQTAGWNCTHAAGLPSGGSSVLTFVLQADDDLLGINDGTIMFGFSANSSVSDPDNSDNSETESTAYVTPDADIQVTVSDSPDPVFPDGDITYTVSVQNVGPDTAPNVTLNVPMNNTLRFQSVTAPAGWSCTPPAVGAGTSWSCTIASLPVQPASVFTIVLRANDEQFGINDQTINQFFGANSSVSDPNNANNGETESTLYTTPDANVSITASDSPDPVTNGSNLTFTVDVANAGPDAGPNASVIMSPHPSLTFQSVTAPAGWSCTTPAVDAAGPVQCTKGSIANAETAQFTLVTRLVTAGAGGTLDSDFSVGTSAQDPVPANNSVEVFTNWIGQTSDLSIDKSTLSTAAAQGSTITYTISTANNGPDSASNVTVTDVLQPSLLFQSITAPAGWNCTTPAAGTNGTITCTLAAFANGATAQFTLVTTVAPDATGQIANNATIGSGNLDPNAGNSTGASGSVIVAGNADLGVTKTTAATAAVPGNAISYTITVTNNGPDPAASQVMTDTLPATLLFQSIAAPGGWNCTTPAVGTTGTITCSAATLANGGNAVFTLNATVAPSATGTITNTASASHSGTDGNGGNNAGTSAPVPVGAAPAPNLTIDKTTTATTVTVGTVFNYTITVGNTGQATATSVVVTDTLPAELELVSATPSQGSCSGTTTVTCNLGSIPVEADATITLQVRAIAAGNSIINNVVVNAANDGPEGDAAPAVIAVGGPASEAEIPTLSEWMLLALMAMLGLAAVVRMRT